MDLIRISCDGGTEATDESRRVSALRFLDCRTPAYVYDEAQIVSSISCIRDILREASCSVLYSVKACPLYGALRLIAGRVDGFACSSLFEARLARNVLGDKGTVHVTTPGLRPDEIGALGELCDYVSCNSLSQLTRFEGRFESRLRRGLRINPKLSFLDEDRYDPCRKHSKLGASLEEVAESLQNDPQRLAGLTGIHVHNNRNSHDFGELHSLVRHVVARLSPLLSGLEWINLGGGYLFDDLASSAWLYEAVDLLRSEFGLEVYLEPGTAIVRDAGYLLSTVIDVFVSDGKLVAVLDTTVSHWPEVFEYQIKPHVIGHEEEGAHRYILAGCTCLAGDLFGEYGFDEPLEVGSRVIFAGAGAYTLSKACMFNGINLPAVYTLTENGDLALRRQYTYEDYAGYTGAPPDHRAGTAEVRSDPSGTLGI